jgi:putative oxidoreductase
MKNYIPKISRYLLGLIFFASGVVGLFNLVPPPPDMPVAMQTFMTGMMATQYFFPFLKLTEIICGLLLLAGIAPALALVILAPITLNIFLVHFFVTPGVQNLVVPLVIVALHVVTAKSYWSIYKPLFQKQNS